MPGGIGEKPVKIRGVRVIKGPVERPVRVSAPRVLVEVHDVTMMRSREVIGGSTRSPTNRIFSGMPRLSDARISRPVMKMRPSGDEEGVIYLHGGFGVFGLDLGSLFKQGFKRFLDGLKRYFNGYKPMIVATAHDSDASFERDLAHILEAQKRGARSVGLEISPEVLKRGPGQYFGSLAEKARELGMEVVPLFDEATYERAYAIVLARDYIGSNAGFDVGQLEADIREAEESVDYAGPETQEYYVRRLRHLAHALRIINEAKGDIDRFAELWKEGVLSATSAKMLEVVNDRRPDIIVAGSVHARDIAAGAKQYGLIESPLLEDDNMVVLEIIDNVYMPVRDAATVFEMLGRTADDLALQKGMVLNEIDRENLIISAIVERPELVALAVRAGSQTDPVLRMYLIPSQHLFALRVACADAQKTVAKVLAERLSTFKPPDPEAVAEEPVMDDGMTSDVHGTTALGIKALLETFHDNEFEFQKATRALFTTDEEVSRMSAKKRDRAKRAYTAEYEQAIKDEMGRVAPEDELGAHRAKGEAGEQRGVLAQIHESFDGQNDIVETYEFTVRPLIGDDAFSSGLGRYTYTIKCRRVIPPFSLDGVWVLDDMRFVSKEEVTS